MRADQGIALGYCVPGGDVYVNSTGNPGMGTPGMGDALSGMSARSSHSAWARSSPGVGVFLHGYAADRVASADGRVGYIVGDLIDELPMALEALTS